MEIVVEETKYSVALGFGNIMQIQGMLTSAFSDNAFEDIEVSDELTIDDLAAEDSKHALEASAKLMPLVLAKVIKQVNGEPISDSYIDEEMPLTHGVELFNHVMEHISELNVPKVNEVSSEK